jgi:hypothetical protein
MPRLECEPGSRLPVRGPRRSAGHSIVPPLWAQREFSDYPAILWSEDQRGPEDRDASRIPSRVGEGVPFREPRFQNENEAGIYPPRVGEGSPRDRAGFQNENEPGIYLPLPGTGHETPAALDRSSRLSRGSQTPEPGCQTHDLAANLENKGLTSSVCLAACLPNTFAGRPRSVSCVRLSARVISGTAARRPQMTCTRMGPGSGQPEPRVSMISCHGDARRAARRRARPLPSFRRLIATSKRPRPSARATRPEKISPPKFFTERSA